MFKFLLFLFASAAAAAQSITPVTGVVHTADVDLAYEIYGSPSAATPLFAVNGGPGLSHQYMLQNDVWQRIAQRRQVIFYDQRGTGKSTRLAAGAAQSMEAQVADLDALRVKLGIGRVDLVGDSYGGLLSIAYVVAHPEHVRRLILSDAVPGWNQIVHLLPQVFPDVQEQEAREQKRLGDTPEAAQASLRAHFRMIFYSPDLMQKYMNGFPDMGYSPGIGAAVGKATAKLDFSGSLKSLTCPTLIITGRYDMNVAPLTAWKMSKAIPGAKIEFFEKSGHLPSYEEPDKYVQVVGQFLGMP